MSGDDDDEHGDDGDGHRHHHVGPSGEVFLVMEGAIVVGGALPSRRNRSAAGRRSKGLDKGSIRWGLIYGCQCAYC